MCLARHLMRAVFTNPRETNDLIEFVTQDHGSEHVYNCFDCNSVDSIPFRLKGYANKILASRALVVIICDIERLPCFSKRKELIISKMAKNELHECLRFVFSKPNIEAVYWEFPDVIGKTIKKLASYSNHSVNDVQVPTVTSDFAGKLKSLCKQYKIRYKKGEFADHFFGILGGNFTSSATLNRFKTLLTGVNEQ